MLLSWTNLTLWNVLFYVSSMKNVLEAVWTKNQVSATFQLEVMGDKKLDTNRQVPVPQDLWRLVFDAIVEVVTLLPEKGKEGRDILYYRMDNIDACLRLCFINFWCRSIEYASSDKCSPAPENCKLCNLSNLDNTVFWSFGRFRCSSVGIANLPILTLYETNMFWSFMQHVLNDYCMIVKKHNAVTHN